MESVEHCDLSDHNIQAAASNEGLNRVEDVPKLAAQYRTMGVVTALPARLSQLITIHFRYTMPFSCEALILAGA